MRSLTIVFLLCVGFFTVDASSADVGLDAVFTKENFARVPVPEDITLVTIGGVFEDIACGVGIAPRDVELNGRVWNVAEHNLTYADAVLSSEKDIHITLTEASLALPVFQVDSKGVLRYKLFFVSKVLLDDRLGVSDNPVGSRFKSISVYLSTQLTEAELENPLIQAIKMGVSFSEATDFDIRHGETCYLQKRLENGVLNLLISFLKAVDPANYQKCLEAGRAELLRGGSMEEVDIIE